MAAAIGWFLANKGRERIVAVIDPLNSGSIRVADKLGFVRYGDRGYHGASKALFERLP